MLFGRLVVSPVAVGTVVGMESRIRGTLPQGRPWSHEARLLLLHMLGALVALGLIGDCVCFEGPTAWVPHKGGSHIHLLHRLLGGGNGRPTACRQMRLGAAGTRKSVPINLFTRTLPLKVRLEHRELASQYSAYANSSKFQSRDTFSGKGESPTTDEVYHLLFSYDPAELSGTDGEPFRYLEGQSVSFLKLRETRNALLDREGPPAKPRLYSVASSPALPDQGLQHSFALCVRHHRYWGPDGKRDPSRDGLCSSLLCTAPIGTEFEVGGPIGSALLLPEDTSVPVIFACTGTGAAPLRSFLRRIVAEPRHGPLIAYIGAGRSSIAPYAREWQALQKLVPPERLQLQFAYSREMTTTQGGKMYVQHLIEKDGDKVLGFLQDGAVMYACGRKDMLPSIKAALQATATRNNLQFDSLFKTLIASRRWRTEVY